MKNRKNFTENRKISQKIEFFYFLEFFLFFCEKILWVCFGQSPVKSTLCAKSPAKK